MAVRLSLKRMRIGLDGKRAVFNMTGLGNYSRTLLQSLSRYFPDNEYLLYSPGFDDHPRLHFLSESNNITVKVPRTLLSRACKPLWRSYLVRADLRRDKIDLFHGLSNELPYAVSRSGARSVVTIHDLIFLRYPELYPRIDRKVYRYKVEYACRAADRIVAVSEQTRQDITGFLDVDPSRVSVVYQSCDPIFYQAVGESQKQQVRARLALPANYLLYVGTIEPRKNLLGVVRALELVKNKTKLHLVVIGRGRNYKNEVQAYVQNHGLTQHVHFLTDIPFSEFPAVYQMATAFVLPSLFEGFGIPITEALWSRCPVITSAGACFGEAGGPSTIYVDPSDTSALAAAIQRVSDDSTLAAKMREDGYSYVQRFKDSETATAMMKLYRQVLTGEIRK